MVRLLRYFAGARKMFTSAARPIRAAYSAFSKTKAGKATSWAFRLLDIYLLYDIFFAGDSSSSPGQEDSAQATAFMASVTQTPLILAYLNIDYDDQQVADTLVSRAAIALLGGNGDDIKAMALFAAVGYRTRGYGGQSGDLYFTPDQLATAITSISKISSPSLSSDDLNEIETGLKELLDKDADGTLARSLDFTAYFFTEYASSMLEAGNKARVSETKFSSGDSGAEQANVDSDLMDTFKGWFSAENGTSNSTNA